MARATTKISLPYGSSVVDIEVPSNNLLAVASLKEVAPQADVATQVPQALRVLISGAPFSDLFKGGENLLLLINDNTRPTPIHEILLFF